MFRIRAVAGGRCMAVVLAISAAPTGFAAAPGPTWPQWRGPARDGVASGFASRAAWPAALRPATGLADPDAMPAWAYPSKFEYSGATACTVCVRRPQWQKR